MSIDNHHYRPGEVANGHRLSADGTVWEPVSPAGSPVVPSAGEASWGLPPGNGTDATFVAHEETGPRMLDDVRQHLGGLTADEESVLYGMTFANELTTHCRELGPSDRESVSRTLVRFRAAPCSFCGRGLSGHSLDLEETGLGVRCRDTDSMHPSDVWIAGPMRTPAWRVMAGIVIWGGIPAVSLGLASWLMPLVSALIWRDRRWGWAASFWALATAAVSVLTSSASSDNPVASLLVVSYVLGSIGYGLAQVKRWLAVLPAPRRRGPRPAAEPPFGASTAHPMSGATQLPSRSGEGRRPDAGQPALPGGTGEAAAEASAGNGPTALTSSPAAISDSPLTELDQSAPGAQGTGKPKIGFWERLRRFHAEWVYSSAHDEWQQQLQLLQQAQDWSRQVEGAAATAKRHAEMTLLETRGTLVEPQRGPGHYSGGSSGVSVPIGFGVRGRVGASSGSYTPGKVAQTEIDTGQITVTTRRVVFAGPLATREWRMDRLVGGAALRSGRSILLPVTNRQKTSGVTVPDPERLLMAVGLAYDLNSSEPAEVLAEVTSQLATHAAAEPAPPTHMTQA